MARIKKFSKPKPKPVEQTLKTGMSIEYMNNMPFLVVPVKADNNYIEDGFISLSSIVAIVPDEYGLAKDCLIQTKDNNIAVNKKSSEIFRFLQNWYATNAMESAIGADDLEDR